MKPQKYYFNQLKLMRILAIIIPALLFSFITDTLHIAILACLAGLLNVFQKSPFEVNLRTTIYGFVIPLTILVLTNAIFKIEDRFNLIPSTLGVPIALLLAMSITFFDDRHTFNSAILVLSVFSLMMCGDVSRPLTFKTLPFPEEYGTIKVLHAVYISALLLAAIPLFYIMNRCQNRLNLQNKLSSSQIAIKAFLILIIIAIVFFCFRPTQNYLVTISRNFDNAVMSRMVKFYSSYRKTTAFENSVNLRESYFNNIGENKSKILIRVEAKEVPGYLRSRVYENYLNGIWHSETDYSLMNLLQDDHEFSYNTYSFLKLEQTDIKKLDKIQIYLASGFKINNIPHQGKTRYIEMTCETLDQSTSGQVIGKNVDFSGGITLYNDPDWGHADAFNQPIINEDNIYKFLQIPEDEFKSSLQQFLANNPTLQMKSNDPKLYAEQIAVYFNNNFSYQLGVRLPAYQDPITAFLESPDKKGHCEYFASSAVMLLRMSNIPARYVTGFYCSEPHPNKKYFVGRAQDLHAWVEYYDALTKKWYILEATPADGLPHNNGDDNFSFFSATRDNITKWFQDILSNVVRGFFAESVILFLKAIFNFFLWFFDSLPKAVISFLILGVLYWIRYKKNKMKETIYAFNLVEIRQDFEKIIKKLAKLKNIKINNSMTLREIIVEVEAQKKPELAKVVDCLAEYEAIRYSQQQRDSEKLKAFKSKLREALKTRI